MVFRAYAGRMLYSDYWTYMQQNCLHLSKIEMFHQYALISRNWIVPWKILELEFHRLFELNIDYMNPTMIESSSYNNNKNSNHFLYQMRWNIEWQLRKTIKINWIFLLAEIFFLPCSVNPILRSKIQSVNFNSAIFELKEHRLLKFFCLSSSEKICSVLLVSNNNNYFQTVISAQFSLLLSSFSS